MNNMEIEELVETLQKKSQGDARNFLLQFKPLTIIKVCAADSTACDNIFWVRVMQKYLGPGLSKDDPKYDELFHIGQESSFPKGSYAGRSYSQTIIKYLLRSYSELNSNKNLKELLTLYLNLVDINFFIAADYIDNILSGKIEDENDEIVVRNRLNKYAKTLFRNTYTNLPIIIYLRNKNIINFENTIFAEYAVNSSDLEIIKLALKDIDPEYKLDNTISWIEDVILASESPEEFRLLVEKLPKKNVKKYYDYAIQNGITWAADLLAEYLPRS